MISEGAWKGGGGGIHNFGRSRVLPLLLSFGDVVALVEDLPTQENNLRLRGPLSCP